MLCLLDEAMQNDNATTNERAKESPPNSFATPGTNLEQAITKRAGVRHPEIGAMFRHLFGYSCEAGLYSIRPRINLVLYGIAVKLKGV